MLESQSHHLESDELEKIGEMTDGYSGADMSCLCRYFRFKIQSNLVISFDKEQIGVKEPFPVTKCQFTS